MSSEKHHRKQYLYIRANLRARPSKKARQNEAKKVFPKTLAKTLAKGLKDAYITIPAPLWAQTFEKPISRHF